MQSFRAIKGTVLALALATIAGTSAAATIYANNPPPGDLFINPGPANSGQPVDATGWYYNNVRNSGGVGINITHPRSGNGSVFFQVPGMAGKADIEYLPNATPNMAGNFSSNGSLGALSSLSSMAYEWYRDGTSPANSGQHPSLRVILDRDGDLGTTGDRGGLVFERAYNGPTTTVDQWVSETITDSTYLWNFGFQFGSEYDLNGNGYAYDSTLADWKEFMPNATIIGFSSGVGSGWNAFTGAVDNIAWTIAGVTTSNIFEVAAIATAVPEPTTLALMLGAVFGLGFSRRSRRRID